jgi:DNA replication and repair protein RecF
MLQINELRLVNFRSFKERKFVFDDRFVLIEGDNGVGKTTIFEALFYGCYLKSFRTHLAHEIFSHDENHFFFKIDFTDTDSLETSTIQVGVKERTKNVKFNGIPLKKHKELLKQFRVIGLLEDDINLVKGSPSCRRDFLAQLGVLMDAEFSDHLKKYRSVLKQRNSLLYSFKINKTYDYKVIKPQIEPWTLQLLELVRHGQSYYQDLLRRLEIEVNRLCATYFESELTVTFTYLKSLPEEGWEEILMPEVYQGRSLFGLHLDDFVIEFKGKSARGFASRGQQRLTVFLMRVAELGLLNHENVVLLLDDFLTDFDKDRIERAIAIIKSLPCQTLLTSPVSVNLLVNDTIKTQIISV